MPESINPQPSSTVANPAYGVTEDPGAGHLAQSVVQAHSSDFNTLPATGGAALTTGPTQIQSPAGYTDRQRATGVNGIPALGVTTGASQLASAFSTTTTTTTAASVGATPQMVVFTPAAMSGSTRGVPWSIQVGSILTIDAGANREVVEVQTYTVNTFSATCIRAHAFGVAITGFVYNQASDSTLPDGTSPAGIPAGSAYFWNGALNGGAGGLEIERSAAGELDGASGAGTAVAAEYEYNGGGPGGGAYDRARNLQGKGVTTNTLNGAITGGVGATFTLNVGALPTVGQPVYLAPTGATPVAEVVYVQSVVAGVVTCTSNVLNNHANAGIVSWDSYAGPVGPGLSGFLPTGVGIEEECLYDPVSQLYYVERSATQDAVAAANVVLEAPGLWNGATIDRARAASANPTSGVGIEVCATGLSPLTSLAAQSVLNTNGTVLDGGVCHSHHSLVVSSGAGVSAGAVQLQGSLDNANWFSLGSAVTTNAANTTFLPVFVANSPSRFLRATISTGITGGTVTALVGTSG